MKNFLSVAQTCLQSSFEAREIRALTKALLLHYGVCSATDFYVGKDINISEEQSSELMLALQRLSQGEPLQYILGCCEFYGLSFKTKAPVLIPRPETEELVDWVIKDQLGKPGRLLDVGCGSGCISVSLAKYLNMQVEAWDILPEALALCQENALQQQVSVELKHQDLFKAIAPTEAVAPGPYEVIVSNPPYICQSQSAHMQANVLNYESHLALFVPDDDALKYYRALAELGKHSLLENGCLYLEINELFGQATLSMLQDAGYRSVELRRDLSGRDRMIKACL